MGIAFRLYKAYMQSARAFFSFIEEGSSVYVEHNDEISSIGYRNVRRSTVVREVAKEIVLNDVLCIPQLT